MLNFFEFEFISYVKHGCKQLVQNYKTQFVY